MSAFDYHRVDVEKFHYPDKTWARSMPFSMYSPFINDVINDVSNDIGCRPLHVFSMPFFKSFLNTMYFALSTIIFLPDRCKRKLVVIQAATQFAVYLCNTIFRHLLLLPSLYYPMVYMTLFAITHQACALRLRWHILPVGWDRIVQIVWRANQAIRILHSLPSSSWCNYSLYNTAIQIPAFLLSCFPAVMHPYVHGSRFAWIFADWLTCLGWAQK